MSEALNKHFYHRQKTQLKLRYPGIFHLSKALIKILHSKNKLQEVKLNIRSQAHALSLGVAVKTLQKPYMLLLRKNRFNYQNISVNHVSFDSLYRFKFFFHLY